MRHCERTQGLKSLGFWRLLFDASQRSIIGSVFT
jgi:hypothetical protein